MLVMELLKADVAISNPPFNLKVPVSENIIKALPQKYTCNFAFVAHCLQRSERCALILPRGVLTSKEEKECRRYFIEKGWLQAAISLPEKMFESTSVATCILLFDKKKTSKDVMLINAEQMKTVEVREQRGEAELQLACTPILLHSLLLMPDFHGYWGLLDQLA